MHEFLSEAREPLDEALEGTGILQADELQRIKNETEYVRDDEGRRFEFQEAMSRIEEDAYGALDEASEEAKQRAMTALENEHPDLFDD